MDLGAANIVGLDVNRLIIDAFVLASGFAGLAGVLWAAQSGVVEPAMGFTPLLKAFIAAIIGGFGSIPGAVVGGVLIGVIESMAGFYLPQGWKDVAPYVVLLMVLLLKPEGLFGHHVRKKV